MDTAKFSTTCPMDCPDTCALEISVADGRVTELRGSKDSPVTQGFICDKVARFGRRLEHESRILFPMRRSGPKGSGAFERITWDEAVAEIAARFREISARWGAEAILPYHYGGSNGFLSDGTADDYFFAKLGASRLARTLCAAPASACATAIYGKMPGVAFEDYAHAKFILLWGGNPKASNIHLVPFLKAAKRNGAFIAVVDPVRNFSSGEVDLHLPVYPGTDLPVALAMIRHWHANDELDHDFLVRHCDGLERLLAAAERWPLERAAEVARVPARDIAHLAEVYASSHPAVLRVAWGMERNRNGGQAMAAVLAMPALLGKFGVRGGGYTLSNGAASRLDKDAIFGPLNWGTREINMSQLADVLTGDLRPPVKALFVYNCNPAATVPDQNRILRGLAREDLFTVVHEQVMTDTALFADVLLPATTFLEHFDVRRGYGNYVVGGIRPVIPARGEAKPNEEVFALLGRAMGWNDPPFQWDSATWVRKIAAALEMPGGPLSAERLLSGGSQRYDFPGELPVQFVNVFPRTPDGRIHLAPDALGPEPFLYLPLDDPRYPLALISPSTSRLISSTLGEFNFPELYVLIHPGDASARGISSGDWVKVFNQLGVVECRAKVSDRVRPGVVSMPKGAWRKSSRNGQTATALCPSHVSFVGGGACFNDARVEIARL